VPGWFYNLGITGLRAQLVADEPKALLIKYVFPGSPADSQVKIGDLVVGAGGRMFQENHRNGYGEEVFGADGPISELAEVLEECQSADRKGKLPLTLRRGKEIVEVSLDVGTKYGTFAPTFPHKCQKSDLIVAELLQYLVDHQQQDGSFGDPVHDTFAPLALLASGEAKYLSAVERNVKYHCGVTKAKDLGLPNWYYMSAAIVLSEYQLATGDRAVLPDLQKVHDLMAKGQYLHMSQINPQAKKSHPDSFPKGPSDSHGGWGHNPGFEGYGPIAMLTGQGALAYSLMDRCGIKIDRKKHDAAYDFLKRGTGENGYVWYGDQKGGGPENWADMGRTGAAGIANFLCPYDDTVYGERALFHARVIGKHPQSFPDTHGSPPMGMAYTALAASVDADSFRKLMDANRWWFTMAHCTDGSFYYQPNRDNSGYGSDSRTIASAVTAFILTIPKRGLVMTGKEGNAAPKRADKSGTESKPLKVFILTYSDLTEAKGKLTAGFGAPENKIGPEFTFGLIMEKQLNEPVLIIKTSWGGRSLHTDFRPPNGGALAWSEAELAEKKRQGEDIEKIKAEKATASGVDYREMIANEQNNTGGYDLYANLLGHFIRDVRKDLSAPNMPFVIGVRIEDCARVASAPCIRLRG